MDRIHVTTLSLRSWVLILSLAPTLLVGIMLASYFTIHRFQELDETLIERGTDIIEPLAIASEYGMLQTSREMLKRLLGVSHRKHSHLVRSIAIFDTRHRVFVSSNFHRNFNQLRLPPGSSIPSHTELEYLPNGDLIMRTPIVQESNLLGLDADKPAPVLGYVVVHLNTDWAALKQHESGLAAILIILVGAFVNLLFSVRLIGQVTQPISDMVDAVEMIRKGRLDTRVDGRKIGELEELRGGINAMAQSLEESQQELQMNVDQATADLRETLEQIEIQNIELDMANRRAQEANRVKSEFLANMSHELRTPLNGVIGFSHQLAKTQLNTHQAEYVSTIERSANNLLTIINDILDFSKLEAGKLKLEQMPFQLRESLYEVATLFAPASQEKRIELVVTVEQPVPDNLVGDAFRIKQVLTNLVGNAIKFTESGHIHIHVELLNDEDERVMLKVSVQDTGIGISNEQKQSLFQAFGQGDTSITRRFGGTGLGLVISQRLVNKMGGEMSFDSQPGLGSTFWFTLNCPRSPLPLGDPLPLQKLKGKKVLLFEPAELSLQALQEPLRSVGIDLSTCQRQEQWPALLADDAQYHAVILACGSANSDMARLGQLIQQARNQAKLVLVMCNQANPGAHEQICALGADECLSKPVNPHRLARLIAAGEQAERRVKTALPPSKLAAHVLVVDDNPANLKLLQTLLAERVVQVSIASDGEEALRTASRQAFDLIMMDIQMPRMDGVTAAGKIRNTLRNRATPIVAVTAHALEGEKEKLLSQGMDEYLAKPVDEAALDRVLRSWLKPAHQSEESTPKSPDTGSLLPELVVRTEDIDVIDWPLAITRAGGRESLAKEMLQMLTDSLPDSRDTIDAAFHAQDSELLQQAVHKLNGACCYTGVPRLQALAHEIETQLKRGQAVDALEPEYLELCDEINKVMQATETV